MLKIFRWFLPSLLVTATAVAQPLSSSGSDSRPLFDLLPPERTGITFADNIVETEVMNGVNYTNAYNGSGVAAGDVNGDGLPDLYFCGTQAGSRLYLNKGDFRFEDVTERAGVADSGYIRRGPAFADIDGDGDLDLFVCHINSPNKLFINNGDGTFTERAREFGLNLSTHSTHAAFLDYDLDGDLDLYLGITGAANGGYYALFGVPDRLYRNNGDGTFTDVSKEAGITDAGYVHSVVVADLNDDGYPDLYVSNDFQAKDNCYINNRNGTFTDVLNSYFLHVSYSTMGIDIADYNNDGLLDIMSADMLPSDHYREMELAATLSVHNPIYDSTQVSRNTLQLNRGNGIFSEVGQLAGVSTTDWSWAVLFADFDNDGYKDLFVANGIKRDLGELDPSYRISEGADLQVKEANPISVMQTKLKIMQLYRSAPIPNHIYRNNRDLTFADVSRSWGVDQPSFSHGAAYVDLDLDGDLDLVVNNVDAPAFIHKNNAVERKLGNFLRVNLVGAGKNRLGLGARVEIRHNGNRQVVEQSPSRGYVSSVDPVLHFGLGNDTVVEELSVRWPGGATQTLKNVPANGLVTLEQKNAGKPKDIKPKQAAPPPLFTQLDTARTINARHMENTFDDLKRERVLPRRLSQSGPGMAAADVNGDGLDDIYVGGAHNFPGRILRQSASGKFVEGPWNAPFAADSAAEDMGAIFFDADGDRDLDLLVVSGGNEFDLNDPALQDRLYLNSGNGGFTKAPENLPAETTSGSCVAAADFDRDGDLDLFIGGRLVPGNYPLAARSFILRNDRGRFSDVTAEVAPQLAEAGMVCAALWSDYDNDGDIDLMTAGEWMPLVLYRNESGRLSRAEGTGLEGSSGWWNSVVGGDFDNDGDIDYVAGNLGLNWRYKASPDAPVEMYAYDFDGNGSLDGILAYNDRRYGKLFPTLERDRMASQIPSIQAKFNTYTGYANASLQEMFPAEKLKNAYNVKAQNFATSYIENLGEGRFAVRDLPVIAQVAPVFGIVADDYNADGKLDLFLAGNLYDGPEPKVVRYDASCGLVLLGDGRGGFSPLSPAESGVVARGDARGAMPLRIGKGGSASLCNVVANNGGKLQTFKADLAKTRAKLFTLEQGTQATHAVLLMKDGSKRRQEFSLGSGYLTSGSQTIVIPPSVASLTLYNGKELVRTISF